MRIALYGFTDKRVIVMSLIKLLQTTGEILVVSDNRHFMRYTEDRSSFGFFLNTTILVTDSTPEEVLEDNELELDDYTHIIYDLYTTMYAEADLQLYVAPLNVEESERHVMAALDNVKPIYVKYPKMRPSGDLVTKKVSKTRKRKNSKGEEDVQEEISVIEEFPVHLKMDSAKNVLNMTFALLTAIELSESTRTLPVISDRSLARVLANVVGDEVAGDVKHITAILKERS